MAEKLFEELEQKLMTLLTDREELLKEKQLSQQEMQRLHQEISILKAEREKSMQKLSDLLSLMKSVSEGVSAPAHEIDLTSATHLAHVKPMLVQG